MAAKEKTTAKKSTKNSTNGKKLATMGKKITSKAKEIRKNNPSKEWKKCMKEAGKALKGKF